MFNRPYRRQKRISLKVLDPLGVFALLAVMTLPILTVVNLTPQTEPVSKQEVLGIEYKEDSTGVELVGGYHSVVTKETISKEGFLTTYSLVLNRREAGHYSKPIFKIYNTTDKTIKYRLSTKAENIADTELSLQYQSSSYIVHNVTGEYFVRTVELAPGEDALVYLVVKDRSNVNYLTPVQIGILQEDPF